MNYASQVMVDIDTDLSGIESKRYRMLQTPCNE